MNRPYLGVVVVLALAASVGCSFIGAPERAGDTQNVNGISDDISALTMTQADVMHAADPNANTVFPRNYELHEQ